MVRVALFVLVVTYTCWGASLDAWGENWPRFRGPNGTGVAAAQFPHQWTSADYSWKTELPGIGHSSPVIWGSQLFIQSADPDSATRYLVSVSTTDGSIMWKQEFPSAPFPIHTRSSFASTTPAVDEERVYAAWASPTDTHLVALDHRGKIVWQRELGPLSCQHGFGCSPIVVDDLVILNLSQEPAKENADAATPGPSQILAVDRRTGETRWTTPRESKVMSYSVPCLHPRGDGQWDLIGCSTAEGIFALDPLSGAPRWSLPVFEMRTVSSPLSVDGLLIGTTGSGGGGNYVVALRPGESPAVAYHVRKQAPYVPTPVAKDGYLYLWSDKGIVTCVRAADGNPLWQERIGGNYSGSPIIAGDALYCIDEEGVVVVLAAAPEFAVLGRIPLEEASRSTPAVGDGKMFFRTYSHLFALSSEKTNGSR